MLGGIQWLRGLAAALVVFHHYVSAMAPKGWLSGALADTVVGNAGVDLFFVISGFIMAYTAQRRSIQEPGPGSTSALDFMVRRAIRIVPLLWVLILAAVSLHLIVGPGESLKVDGWRVLLSMLLLPDPRQPMNALAFVIPMAWSLTYEAYFYGLFALSLRWAAQRRLIVLGAWFAAGTVLGMLWTPQTPLLQLVVDPLLWEFWAGCGLAQLYLGGVRLRAPVVGLLVVGAVVGLGLDLAAAWNLRLLSWGVPAWMVVAAVVLSRYERASQAPGWMWRAGVRLGDWSYSLYLTHFFALSAFVRAYARWGEPLVDHPWLTAALFAALALGVAGASYRWIEQPSRMWLTAWWARRRQAACGGEVQFQLRQ